MTEDKQSLFRKKYWYIKNQATYTGSLTILKMEKSGLIYLVFPCLFFIQFLLYIQSALNNFHYIIYIMIRSSGMSSLHNTSDPRTVFPKDA